MVPSIDKFIGTITAYPFPATNQQITDYLNATFARMTEIGMAAVRMAFWWSRSGNDFSFGTFPAEDIIAMAAARGWRVYGIINPPPTSTPGWTPPTITPDMLAVFKKFVAEMGRRYGNAIEHWEILNEANHDNIAGDGSLAAMHFEGHAFASLLRESYLSLVEGFGQRTDYPQLKAQRGGAGFKLYPAGTAGTDLAWIQAVGEGLDALYAAHPGEGPYIDGFSIHPFSAPNGPDVPIEYNSPAPPYPKISQGTLLQNIEWALFRMAAHPRVPRRLFIGEYGWSTKSQSNPAAVVTPELQARYLAQGYLEAHASGLVEQAIGAWLLIDLNNQWDFWDHTGLIDTNGQPKPAYYAVKNLTARLAGMAAQQNLSWLLPDGRMFLYKDSGKRLLAHWNHTTTTFTVTLPANAHFRHYNLRGTLLREETSTGAPITLTSEPDTRYLEVTGGAILAVNGVPLTADGVPTVAGTPVKFAALKASSSGAGHEPQYAADGNPGTYWNAGQFGQAWWEGTFAAPIGLRGLTLRVSQLPSGTTQHQVQLQINGAWQTADTFGSHTVEGMTLALQFASPKANVARVRILTTSSPSYPAWYEVVAYR